jgi:small GTP-binding protein
MSILRSRVVVAGDATVGKTAILSQFIKGSFNKNYSMTQACEYSNKEVAIQDTHAITELHFLDIAGHSIFKDIIGELMGNANSMMLVYDATNPESFNSLNTWYD